jgi:hypothetical protein
MGHLSIALRLICERNRRRDRLLAQRAFIEGPRQTSRIAP